MADKILIIAAHPDDEVLGCGGTMAKLASQGVQVHVVILAEGITSRDKKRDRTAKHKELGSLKKAAEAANKMLGVTSLTFHDFPDNRMDGIELLDIIKCVESHIDKIRPQMVFTHHAGDVNIDHQITHKAVVTACRPLPEHPVQSLLFFEVPSSTEWQPPQSGTPFSPNWFVDIGEKGNSDQTFLDIKLESLKCYRSEMRPWPHPRSIEAVKSTAQCRGASVGIPAAEAFVLGRFIERTI